MEQSLYFPCMTSSGHRDNFTSRLRGLKLGGIKWIEVVSDKVLSEPDNRIA